METQTGENDSFINTQGKIIILKHSKKIIWGEKQGKKLNNLGENIIKNVSFKGKKPEKIIIIWAKKWKN